MRRSAPPVFVALLSTAVFVAGCNVEADKKIAKLEKRVAELERKNEQLERRMAHLGAERGPKPPGSDPFAGFGKLLGQLSKGNFKIQPRTPSTVGPGRQRPMDAELQKRIDKMMVEGLEKLSKSEDAKELVKLILKAMKHDLERQTGGAK